MPLAYEQIGISQTSLDSITKLIKSEDSLNKTKLNPIEQKKELVPITEKNDVYGKSINDISSEAKSKTANAYEDLKNVNNAKDISRTSLSTTTLMLNTTLNKKHNEKKPSFFKSLINKVDEITKDKNKIKKIKDNTKTSMELLKAVNDPNKLQSEVAKMLSKHPDILSAKSKSALAKLDKILCGDKDAALNNVYTATSIDKLTDAAAFGLLSCSIDTSKATNMLMDYVKRNAISNISNKIENKVLSVTGSVTAKTTTSFVINKAIHGGKVNFKEVSKVVLKTAKKTKEKDKILIKIIRSSIKSMKAKYKADKMKATKSDKKTNEKTLNLISDILGKDKYQGRHKQKYKKDINGDELLTPPQLADKIIKETTTSEDNLDNKPEIDNTAKIKLLTGINENINIT